MGAANHYALLGLSPQASGPELRQAFRRLSKRYHPDTTELPRAQAEEAFRQLQQAYLTLSDPERRRAYDASLAAPPSPRPSTGPSARPLVVTTTAPASVRRALSGGEWFALVLLALAVLFSLVLGVGLAWARGAELVRPPSWWPVAGQTELLSDAAAADVSPASRPGAALPPSAAGAGALAAGAGGGAAGPALLPVEPQPPRLDRPDRAGD